MCKNSNNEQKTQSEEDGSSASTSLIAHDSPRLANYALWSIQHKPINHNCSQQQHKAHGATPQQMEMMLAWTLQQGCRSTAMFNTCGGGLDLRGTVGDRHEESDTEPQSLQQDDNQPLWPVNNHILDWAPPVTLEHNRETLRRVFKSKGVRLRSHLLVSISGFHRTSLPVLDWPCCVIRFQ